MAFDTETIEILDGKRPGGPLGLVSQDKRFGTTLEARLAALEGEVGAGGTLTADTITEATANNGVRVVKRLTTTDGVASGTARVVGGIAMSDPVASTALTGTSETQTNFDHGTYTVPANTLKVGTIVRVRGRGRYTATTGTETHIFGVAFGATNLCVTGSLDPANDGVFDIEFEFVCRAVGASGTVVGSGVARSGAQATASPAFHLLSTGTGSTSTTTVDTTASAALAIFVDRQATATDSDSMRLDTFAVEIIG